MVESPVRRKVYEVGNVRTSDLTVDTLEQGNLGWGSLP